MHHKCRILLQKSLTSFNNYHKKSLNAAINGSYRALLARASRSTLTACINKYMPHLVAMSISGYSTFSGNACIVICLTCIVSFVLEICVVHFMFMVWVRSDIFSQRHFIILYSMDNSSFFS